MRYASIDSCEIVNGKHVGLSLYVQGCEFHCTGCFNSSTWDFNGGKEWNSDIEDYVIYLCSKPYIKRVSILGGEPLHKINIDTVHSFLQRLRYEMPQKIIWLWTGFKFEEIKDHPIIECINYIVDGQYIEALHKYNLVFRGSSNQRVIDVQASLKTNSIVLWDK